MDFISIIDWSTATMLVGWTLAIVAGIRAKVRYIDGPWVLLLALLVAAAVSVLAFSPDWIKAARYGVLAWFGAVGGIELVRKEGGALLSKLGNGNGSPAGGHSVKPPNGA